MTTKSIFALALVCSAGVSFSGVAAAADEHAKTAAGAAAAPAAPTPAKIDWEKMNFAARKKYMKSDVLPKMKALFVEFDAKKYSKMSCQTCHGAKATEQKFKMPNAELPKLPQPTDRAGFMALQQKKPEMAKFMGTKVKPTMAALLNLPEWSPTKPDGFGCYQCHTKMEGPAGGAAPPAAPPAGGAPAGGKMAPPAGAAPAPKGW
jgi:hypothetical protein